jgi:broad specificity phosphatase PhoE
MQCVLFRHGDKEYATHHDPPLSAKGHAQARAILELLRTGKLPKPSLILSSPKIRAVQTLEPAASQLKSILRLRPELDERQTSEDAQQFINRIRYQLGWLTHQAERSRETYFVVTHSDWIGEALPLLPSPDDLTHDKYQWWRPGQYMHLQFQDGLWQVVEFAVAEPE